MFTDLHWKIEHWKDEYNTCVVRIGIKNNNNEKRYFHKITRPTLLHCQAPYTRL